MTAHHGEFVVWIDEVGKDDVSFVGGKGAHLGDIARAKYPVPLGFIVTTDAYYQFIRDNDLNTKIKHLISTVDFRKPESLMQVSSHIKKEILDGELNHETVSKIFKFYTKLGGLLDYPLVAVRSSSTTEDLKKSSSAGLEESFLNIKGEANLIIKIKEGWASLFDANTIYYRHQNNLDHHTIGIALIVQKMIQSEKSGIMFTIDPTTGDKSKLIIEASYGLGEMITQGELIPDHYEVDKIKSKILSKKIVKQPIKLVRRKDTNKKVKVGKVSAGKQKISDSEILRIAELGKLLEERYYFPQDVEWAIENDKIYILQTRPITTVTNQKKEIQKDIKPSPLLLVGDPASPGIATGPVRIIHSAKDIHKLLPGDILVSPEANPDFIAGIRKSAGVITDFGGKTSHAAIISRELGIPAIVGTGSATSVLKDGNVVTINGQTGQVHIGGFLKTSKAKINDLDHLQTATKVFVNLSDNKNLDEISKQNVDGVGFLTSESIFSNLGVHPKKLIEDGNENTLLSEIIGTLEYVCKTFDPRPVIYKISDYKTNEYRALVGGKDYEPNELNPLLGYRGVHRLITDPDLFKVELKAVKQAREKSGFKNLSIALPLLRSLDELRRIKEIIEKSGLSRSSSFNIWMSVETPSNVILLDKYIEMGIDGLVISDHLSSLMLGVDLENADIQYHFSDENEAILWAYEVIIKTAQKYNIPTTFSKQTLSVDLVEKLLDLGIKNISVSPSAIDETRRQIRQKEKRIIGA